ncbi:DNA polymerase [Pectobacterium phage MA12]|uniref:DNA polymerase n=1 Tax=Pectobacterium phage MA12 TaxID=2686474 RepID=A0A6B9RH20_9CAUD|nr:DNA polymerase [Pectobacterium phage MA11]YP_010000248.1 DNA polymerase [Pectobacterium phage MA12]QGF21034.1 DNA polymerase [Pectobacterium phage MA11]QHI00853.1 DNA polymerase [Pectobacterium phage MA12]
MSQTTTINLDYESKSPVDLKTKGIDRYSSHRDTEVMMASWSINDGTTQHWDYNNGRMPGELREALEDPDVEKWAFNAQFERLMTQRVLKIKTDYESWRCTMVLAYMQGFSGTLEQIGRNVGLSEDKQKMADGKKLIRLFCIPQKPTKNNPHIWRDALTDPDLWEIFCRYNIRDTDTEKAIKRRLIKYPVPMSEWALYALDQQINDRGVPIDMDFVQNAIWMAAHRKKELIAELKRITGLANPNSTPQLLPWLQARGYPFGDIQKDTVKKIVSIPLGKLPVTEGARGNDLGDAYVPVSLQKEMNEALAVRKNASRISIKKYNAIEVARGEDNRFRFSLQMHGASRTGRWAGRRLQTQNLPRTPKFLEGDDDLELSTELVRQGDYDMFSLYVGEPMEALVGLVRSSIRAEEGKELRVCDLASIESVVIGWMCKCEWLMGVLARDHDIYQSFGVHLFDKPYERVTKTERNISKPPTLGCGYRLGGGEMRDGKKTGLWAYAENMGVNMSQDESAYAVKVFRELCPEIVQTWYDLERAVEKCVRTGATVQCGVIRFEMKKPYLCAVLPSGRRLYYFKPRIETKEFQGKTGPYMKKTFSYEGQDQKTGQWVRIYSHGGKLVENFVQAIARDIIKAGLIRASRAGFDIVMHVHDEIVTEQPIDDKVHTVALLSHCMTDKISWAPGLPLKAAGWAGPFYKKD